MTGLFIRYSESISPALLSPFTFVVVKDTLWQTMILYSLHSCLSAYFHLKASHIKPTLSNNIYIFYNNNKNN